MYHYDHTMKYLLIHRHEFIVWFISRNIKILNFFLVQIRRDNMAFFQIAYHIVIWISIVAYIWNIDINNSIDVIVLIIWPRVLTDSAPSLYNDNDWSISIPGETE